MAGERAHLGLLEVPELEGTAGGAGDDHLLGLVEGDALHRGLVTGEGEDRLRLADGEEVDALVLAARHHHAAGFAPYLQAVHRAQGVCAANSCDGGGGRAAFHHRVERESKGQGSGRERGTRGCPQTIRGGFRI